MGKQLGCDVDWTLAPSLAICYSEGCFRDNQGRWWNEDVKEWRNGGYTNEELAQAIDFEPRPDEFRDKEYYQLQNTASVEAPSGAIKSDGGSSSYYDISIPDWLFDKIYERRYSENCYIKTEELIEVLGSDFDEGNILKCLVRINSLKKGKGKEGNDVTYDSNKIIYSAGRLKERVREI